MMNNVMPTLKYLALTIKHKWFVWKIGRKWKLPIWRLIKHDWTKFLPSELPHYGRQFFGKADQPERFARCWLRHQNRNEHHWEYWIPRSGHTRCVPPFLDNEPLQMSGIALIEMMADWAAAGRAYEGKWPNFGEWEWINKNWNKLVLHEITREELNWIVSGLSNENSLP
jgi:hypothetical protein